jgi:hypothetical protein
VPFVAAMAVCLLGIAPTLRYGWQRLEAAIPHFGAELRADFEAFGRAMPENATVVAPWSATQAFVFWAPRAAYLNVLDPIFMLAKDPDLYRAYLDVFQGREADIPFAAHARFDSRFYADDGQYRSRGTGS